MRRYIFTGAELKCLESWLKEGGRESLNYDASEQVRNADSLLVNVELKALTLRKVRIDPNSKRLEYVRRLENMISMCE